MRPRLVIFVLAGHFVACQGSEPCEGARCTQADAPEASNPWFVYVGDDLGDAPFRLFGVSEAEMGITDPIELSAGVATDDYVAPTFHAWSPNGRVLVFDMMNADFQSRFFYATFGADTPSPAAPLPDLPFSDGWSPEVRWSAGSEIATVREGTNIYFLDFRSGEPLASSFAPEGVVVTEAWPCANAEHVAYETDSGEAFVAPATSPEEAESLGEGELVMSPDGEHVAIFSSDGVWTAPCGAGGARRTHETSAIAEPLFGFPWSADSRFLAFELPESDDDSVSIAVVDAVGDAEPVTVLTSDGFVRWDETSPRLLIESDASGTPSVATFPGGELSSLGLPPGALDVTLHAAGVSYALIDEETYEKREFLWLDGADEPELLVGCNSSAVAFDEGPTTAACIEESDLGSQLLVFSVGPDATLSRVELGEPEPAMLSVHEFSPSGRGLVASRSSATDESSISLLWIELPFEPDGAVTTINLGDLAYGTSWQPSAPRR